jgi:hypothetical protein
MSSFNKKFKRYRVSFAFFVLLRRFFHHMSLVIVHETKKWTKENLPHILVNKSEDGCIILFD